MPRFPCPHRSDIGFDWLRLLAVMSTQPCRVEMASAHEPRNGVTSRREPRVDLLMSMSHDSYAEDRIGTVYEAARRLVNYDQRDRGPIHRTAHTRWARTCVIDIDYRRDDARVYERASCGRSYRRPAADVAGRRDGARPAGEDAGVPCVYCAGTYVGSCVAASITEPYAVTRPVPLSTFTVTRAL